MIQFNLLPDVKLQFVRAQRLKRLIILVCAIVSSVAVGLTILMVFVVTVFQQTHLSNLDTDITKQRKSLESVEDLNKILTIQNQLTSLPALHDQKPVATRLFGYLQQVTPNDISIARLEVDFDQQMIKISGKGKDLQTVNIFVDTLKFTDFAVKAEDGAADPTRAFGDVVLTGFEKLREDKGTEYTIELKFKPDIFDQTKTVTLIVTKKVTTRSATEKPNVLFAEPEPVIEENQ